MRFDKEPSNSKTKNLGLLARFVESMRRSPQDWEKYFNRGRLNKALISREVGIGLSAWKNNEELKAAFERLERDLAAQGLPKEPGKSGLRSNVVKPKKEMNHEVEVGFTDSKEVRRLKQRIGTLQEENIRLKAELSRLREFKSTLIDVGLFN